MFRIPLNAMHHCRGHVSEHVPKGSLGAPPVGQVGDAPKYASHCARDVRAKGVPWLCLVHEEHHAAEERCAQGAHEKAEQWCAFARVEEEREGARVGQRYGGPIDRLKARVLQDAAVWSRLFCELAEGVGCSESGDVGAPRHHLVRRARLSC